MTGDRAEETVAVFHGTCPNCGTVSDAGYNNERSPPIFDCDNGNCRVEVFEADGC